jgi:hypothetical protein
MKINKDALKKKVREPSTWAGLVGLVTVALGLPISPETLIVAITSIVSIFVTEKEKN